MEYVDGSSASVAQGNAPLQEEGSARVCLVSLAGELFAIDLHHVREVFEIESVTRVPGMPPALVGVANLRGVVLPLVDLRVVLGFSTKGPTPRTGVVVQHGTQQIAILVDRVPEIQTVQKGQFLPVPKGHAQGSRPFVSAILRVEDRLGGVVEVPTLLAYVNAGVLS